MAYEEDLGRRLALARQEAGLTQDQLASEAQLERTALAKIETGNRRVTALELARLASALDQRVEWFLEDAPPAVMSRRNAADPGAPSPVIDRVAERVAREVEFVVELGHGPDLTATPDIDMPSTTQDVEGCAREARYLLEYGEVDPAVDLSRNVARIGLLVFSLDLGNEAADGASILLRRGGIAIVNGSRHLGRRRLTLAHELGHYLFADEFSVDWRVADASAGYRESLVDRFARAFLLPADAMENAWEAHRANHCDARTSAVRIASDFRVDMATLARRLQEVGVISGTDAQVVRAARTTRADFLDFDLFVPQELTSPELPRVYEEAVLCAYRAEDISSDRALELSLEIWQEDDLPAISGLPQNAIWKFVS